MSHKNKSSIPPLLKKFKVAALVEPSVSDNHSLVNQEAVKFDRHRESKRQSSEHPVGIMQNRFAKVDAEFRKILDPRNYRFVVNSVYPTHKFEIVQSSEMLLECAAEGQRPGNSHAAPDQSGRRALGAAYEAY
jgi:hypothetical protein